MTRSPRLRRRALWSAPVLTAAAVAGIASWPSSASADPHPNLPARSAAQLLADVESADVEHFSGTVVETTRLGLPSLPGADSAALTWQTLVTGSHTVRVWVDGADKQRVALLAQLAESDVIHDGSDLWTFASDSQTVGHTVLTGTTKRATSENKHAAADQLTSQTPVGVADKALQAIDPSTAVTVDRTERVAGRAAYTLVLTPRDTRSTVRRVTIALDAQHKLPLRVQVFGTGSRPAIEIGFSNISFARPAASTFRFTAPKGATVTKDLFPLLSRTGPRDRNTPDAGASPSSTTPATSTVGSGWTSVLVLSGTGGALPGLGGHGSSEIDKLFTTQSDGSRLLQTALVNILVTPEGKVAIGAVQPSLLHSAVG